MRRLAFVLSLVSSISFAGSVAAQQGTLAPAPTAPVVAPVTQQTLAYEAPSVARMTIAPGLGIVGPLVGFGANFDIAFRAGTAPVYLGLLTGIQLWGDLAVSGSMTNPTASGTSILMVPILLSFVYRAEIAGSFVHPFIGMAVGPALLSGVSSSGGSASAVTFSALIRWGLEFEIQKNFSICFEPKLGLVGPLFYFAPNLGFVVSF